MSDPKVCVDKADDLPKEMGKRLTMQKGKLWERMGPGNGPILLRVGFLDGTDGLHAKVRTAAEEWTQYANVKFAYGTPAELCDIRISFQADPGSWSYLGKEALDIPKDRPTMNYGWLTLETQPEEIRRVVLHEFGHALGCVHEHSHPEAGIPWNREKVYDFYERTQGWTAEEVNQNVLYQYDRTLTVHSRFDERSIMLYPVRPELTDGRYSTDLNTELSETDKAFIAQMYPRTQGA